MKLTLSVIAYHLASKYDEIIELCPYDKASTLNRARFFDHNHCEDDIVYLLHWEDVIAESACPQSIICVGGEKEACSYFENNRIDALVLSGNTELPLLFQDICDIFYMYNGYEQEIKDSIIREDGLKSTLNIVSKIFDNQVLVVDGVLRVLSWSGSDNDNSDDPLWQETLTQGMTSQTFMNIIKEKGIVNLLNETQGAFYVNEPPVKPFLHANFMEKGERIASISVACQNNDLDERLLPVLDNIVDLLKIVVFRIGNAYYLKSSNMQKIILDMLGGSLLDDELLKRNLAAIRWNISDEYQMIRVEMDQKDISGGLAKYTHEIVRNMFLDSILVNLQNAFLFIIHRSGHQNTDDVLNTEFSAFLRNRKCKAGISMSYFNFAQSATAYKLASVALEKGNTLEKDKVLYHYEDYLTTHIIDLCALSLDVASLCHPEAVKLFQYDKDHKTRYFDSLYMYIMEEKCLALAAKKLNIHRNTLVYRLAKVNDICSFDIKNSSLRMHFIWFYLVLEQQKK